MIVSFCTGSTLSGRMDSSIFAVMFLKQQCGITGNLNYWTHVSPVTIKTEIPQYFSQYVEVV